MRGLLFIFAFLLPVLAGADVYKWIGPDGRIHYSDRRVSGAETVGIQVGRNIPVPTNKPRAGGESADPGLYNAFEIVEPESTETLRDSDGKLGLALLIDPPLFAEHRLRILLDGRPLPGDIAGTQILLQGLAFGSHRVQAIIRNELEEIVASSSLVHFHIRKPLPESP